MRTRQARLACALVVVFGLLLNHALLADSESAPSASPADLVQKALAADRDGSPGARQELLRQALLVRPRLRSGAMAVGFPCAGTANGSRPTRLPRSPTTISNWPPIASGATP